MIDYAMEGTLQQQEVKTMVSSVQSILKGGSVITNIQAQLKIGKPWDKGKHEGDEVVS